MRRALQGLAVASLLIPTAAHAQDQEPTAPPPAEAPAVEAPPPPPPPPPDATPPRPWRFTGTIGAISLPRLLSLELLARYRRAKDPDWDLFAVGAGIEYLPPSIANFGERTTLSWFQVGPEARYFFYRFLFGGLRLGYQFARADSENFGSEVDYTTSSFFLAPKIGVLHTFKSGFTIGGDLGATIPIGASTERESNGTTDSNARKASKTFGMFVMPFLSFRLGWTI